MEVVYEGIRLTPAQIARSAVDEGVHVIGLSILSGSHRELIPDVLAALREAGGGDIPVVVGGIIPEADAARAARGRRRRGLHAEGLRAHAHPPRRRRDRRRAPRCRPAGLRPGATLGARLRRARPRRRARRRSTCSRTARPRSAAEIAALLAEVAPGRLGGEAPGHVVGVTGPPGAGQVDAAERARARVAGRGRTVAVLAVDPSSKRSGGALLGDRARIDADPADRGLFIRSMAAGERLGGLAPATRAAAHALAAAFDVVVVETVGVGQSETEVAETADTVAVVVQPGAGDVLQFLKAGIMEVPDVLVVSKADLGHGRRARGARPARWRCARSATTRPSSPSAPCTPSPASTSSPTRSTRTAPASTSPPPAPARGGSARWPTSPRSTASAACARSAAAGPPSASWPSRTRPRRRRAGARARGARGATA